MKVNQSLIKRMSKNYCPKKVKAEMDGVHKRTASLAMVKGQYFEWKLFGTKTREGTIPELPLKKDGTKRIDQIRIEQQVAKFKDICERHQIKVFGTDRTFHTEMFGHETFGTWDVYGLYRGKPTIIDIKLTQNVNNDFGDFCWGDFESMDKIQAKKYMLAGQKIDGLKYDFLFMVFDYSPDVNHELFFVPWDDTVSLYVQDRLEETISKIEEHEHYGWDPVGYPDECKECPFSDNCPNFITRKEKKAKWSRQKEKSRERIVDRQKAENEVDELIKEAFIF